MSNVWKSDSDGVSVSKVVISKSGHTVAKNYDRQELRSGDIGLEVRLDKGDTKGEMAPEQRTVAQELAQSMSRNLLDKLGASAGGRFEPGTIVQIDEGPALVDADDGNILRLRIFNAQGRLVRTTHALSASPATEVPDQRGINGLIMAEVEQQNIVPLGFTQYGPDPALLLTLFALDQRPGNFRIWYRHRCSDDGDPRADALRYMLTLPDLPTDNYAGIVKAAAMSHDWALELLACEILARVQWEGEDRDDIIDHLLGIRVRSPVITDLRRKQTYERALELIPDSDQVQLACVVESMPQHAAELAFPRLQNAETKVAALATRLAEYVVGEYRGEQELVFISSLLEDLPYTCSFEGGTPDPTHRHGFRWTVVINDRVINLDWTSDSHWWRHYLADRSRSIRELRPFDQAPEQFYQDVEKTLEETR